MAGRYARIYRLMIIVSAVLLPAFLASCGKKEPLLNREGHVEIKRVDIVGLVTPDINAVDFNLIIEDAIVSDDVPKDGQIVVEEIVEEEPLYVVDGDNTSWGEADEEELLSRNMVFDINSEMRGVWVATVKNIDYPSAATAGSSALKNEADKIIDNCAAAGINSIFLQVRPCSDALYRSSIYPWSRYLTGSQGKAPSGDFDPLSYWIDKCHASGIALHAWVNPYRITKDNESLSMLSPQNPAVQHPEWVVVHKGNLYFDPGIPEVRQLVIDGILEIVKNYDVDGIHFDDYFYPNESGESFNDSETYETYGADFQSKAEWRRHNVDELVSRIGPAIRGVDPNIAFGISPSGIWANNNVKSEGSRTSGLSAYSQLYADTRKWAREEWIDYIAPQLYWEIGFSKADYAVLVDWWSRQLEGVSTKLYIGLGDYRTVGATKSVWAGENGIAQIQRQMELNDTYPVIAGEIHYNYSSLVENRGLLAYLTSVYNP